MQRAHDIGMLGRHVFVFVGIGGNVDQHWNERIPAHQFLIKLGAKRLAFVTRPFSAITVDARKAGATAAMLAHGLTVPRDKSMP